MDVAAKWYASGTFWSGAAVVVAILSTAILAWITVWVANPKHLLLFGMKTIPFKKLSDATRSRMDSLAYPRVLEIEIVSQGRRDIPSSAFDQGIPVRLDIDARIVEYLDSESDHTSRAYQLGLDPGETCDRCGPCFIGRHQTLSLWMLVDGPHPRLTCSRRSLIDINVRDKASERRARRWTRLMLAVWPLTVIVLLLFFPPAFSIAAIALSGPLVAWVLARGRRSFLHPFEWGVLGGDSNLSLLIPGARQSRVHAA